MPSPDIPGGGVMPPSPALRGPAFRRDGPHLLPCPFCGGNAYLRSFQIAEDVVATWVQCRACAIKGPEVEDAYADRHTAAAAWNRRAPSHPEEPSNDTP